VNLLHPKLEERIYLDAYVNSSISLNKLVLTHAYLGNNIFAVPEQIRSAVSETIEMAAEILSTIESARCIRETILCSGGCDINNTSGKSLQLLECTSPTLGRSRNINIFGKLRA
jgi:hypothetical protein